MQVAGALTDSQVELRSLAAVQSLVAVPTILQVLCDVTGMGFAAVAHVTDHSWMACAVHDRVDFGLKAGEHLDVHSTLCKEARAARAPVVIDHASVDPVYCDHHTPRQYKIESYVSVPIVLPNGDYFGNLCAIDAAPADVSNSRVRSMFQRFAELIASQLALEENRLKTATILSNERAASELREQFVAVLGHDLRTPVAAVLASADLIERRATDPQFIRDAAVRIRSSGRRMSALIDDVLDFARVRLGDQISVSGDSTVDLGASLRDVVSELRAVNPQRTIESTVTAPLYVQCDPGRMQQVASNLLGNALAHGAPDKPVRLTAGIDGVDCVITVWNAGPAIPQSSMEKIFSPFWRSSTSRNRHGLGLGLHICSAIVAAHHGRLTAESSSEEGTTFTVRFPLRK